MPESVRNLNESVKSLDDRTRTLTDSVKHVDDQLRRRTVVIACFLGAIAIVLLATVPAMVKVSLDNRDAIDENNKRFCPLVAVLIPQPGEAQPSTPRGKQMASDARVIAKDFGCKQVAASPSN